MACSGKFAYCSIYPETSGCCVCWHFLSLSLLRYLVLDLSFVERRDRALSQVDNKVGAAGIMV